MYESGKKAGNINSMRSISESIWNFEVGEDRNGMDQNFIYINNYKVPEVIRDIGYDKNEVIIKASNGLDVSKLKDEGLLGQEVNQIVIQWAMEAFTNPEVIHEIMTYINKNNMLSNEFLNDFKLIDLSILRWTHLLPTVSRSLNLVTDGVAIQRANTYTYKTDDYMLATAQAYHPGDFGNQQHIWTATIDGEVSIFTTHPAKPLSDEGALSNSPSYWVGNGRNPHSVQNENINLSLYVIGEEKGFMEKHLVNYTHAYFPEALMDEVILDGQYIFARKDNVLIGMIAKETLSYVDEAHEDLRQEGETTFWITELSTLEEESFQSFIERLKVNSVTFDDEEKVLSYMSNGIEHHMTFDGDYMLNGQVQDLQYDRFEAPYSKTVRKDDVIKIEFNGHELILDFYNCSRVVND